MSIPNPPPLQDRVPPPTSSLSLTSLIMGIIGWVLLPVVGSIIAVITGHMAKKEIRDSGGLLGGDGMATAGLILGYSNIIIGLCTCLVFILFPAALAGILAAGGEMFNINP
jgi:hypothetical protein